MLMLLLLTMTNRIRKNKPTKNRDNIICPKPQ